LKSWAIAEAKAEIASKASSETSDDEIKKESADKADD